MKNLTKTLATTSHSMNFSNLRGLLKDVIGEWGFDAKTSDLFNAIPYTNKEAFFSKTLITINYPGQTTPKGCVEAFSITKAGGVYSLCIIKENGVEYISARVSNLHDRIEDAQRAMETSNYAEQKEVSDIKIKNREKLDREINRARTSRGKRAEIADVVRGLFPNLRLKTGHVTYPIPGDFEIRFIAIIGNVVAEVTDRNGYRQRIKKVSDLVTIIGGKTDA